MRKISSLYIVCIIILLGCNCCNPKKPNGLNTNFSPTLSFTTNPSGNWQIGYSTGTVLAISQFKACNYADISHVIGIWHPDTGSSGYYPYTGQNQTSKTQLDATGGWSAKPGEIVMEGSNTGQYSILLFTAPATGNYKVNVRFEGVHFRISTTDVHVLLNSQSLFSDSINGYGGDSTVHAIQGTRPTTTYSDSLQLQKGDVVTLAVGYGLNDSNYDDTTGLLVDVELVP